MKRKKLIAATLFFLIIIIFIFYKLTSISNLEINLNEVNCTNSLSISDTLNLQGKNYFFLKRDLLNELLKSKFICIKNSNVRFQFPGKVIIDVNRREALARLIPTPSKLLDLETLEASPSTSSAFLDLQFNESTDSSDLLIVDSEGVIFNQGGYDFLPYLFLSAAELNVGKKLDINYFENITKIFTKLRNLAVEFNRSKLSGNYLLVDSSPRLVFDLNQDILKQLTALQLILNKARMDSIVMESLDLRFDKPVAVYSPKKKGS